MVLSFKTVGTLAFTPDVDFLVFIAAASAIFSISPVGTSLPQDGISYNIPIMVPSAGTVDCLATLKAGQLYVASCAAGNYAALYYQRVAPTPPGGA
jgi:hypothetical protein